MDGARARRRRQARQFVGGRNDVQRSSSFHPPAAIVIPDSQHLGEQAMKQNRQVIPIAGLLATMAFAAYTVAQLTAQTPTGNFTNAATAEVRDAQGQVV